MNASVATLGNGFISLRAKGGGGGYLLFKVQVE